MWTPYAPKLQIKFNALAGDLGRRRLQALHNQPQSDDLSLSLLWSPLMQGGFVAA